MKLELAKKIVELDEQIQFAKRAIEYMDDPGNQRVYIAWTSHLRNQILRVTGNEESTFNSQLHNQLRELLVVELAVLEKRMKEMERDEA